ncbi:MAG: SCO family protein [Planctomycetota bacterium]
MSDTPTPPPAPDPPAADGPPERSGPPTWLMLLLLAGVVLPAIGIFIADAVIDVEPAEDALPPMFAMPDFALTDTTGNTFTDEDLAGQRTVVEFVFTQCQLFCPVMSERMSRLQQALDADPSMADVRLISISVDPDNDTPQVLAAYAAAYGRNPDRWELLTGEDRAQVWSLVESGFLLPVSDEPQNPAMPIGHSSKWLIFDSAGFARTTVNAIQGETVEETLAALRYIGPPRN